MEAPSSVNPAEIVADLRRVIQQYSGATPHPSSGAAYLLQYRDALETVGDEAALKVIQGCAEMGMYWGPALLALPKRVSTRGGIASSEDIRAAIAEGTGTDGPTLFAEVRSALERYLHWSEQWAYDLGALWVMQAKIASELPSVYYLFLSGTKGRGKTTALDILSELTGALNASNISVAAVVHYLRDRPNSPICIDEFDARRDSDMDSALASIVRDGYTKGKPYLRWDPTRKEMDECPTYGAKAIGFRGAVDDALEDRGFPLPLSTTALTGTEGARLVGRNMARNLGDLPSRLTKWGERISKEWMAPDFENEDWLAKTKGVVGDGEGANRETLLSMIVLAVADAIGVDVNDSLKAALGLKREVAEANTSTDVEEARETLEGLIGRTGTLTKEAEFYTIRQKEFADAINAKRKERKERPLTSAQIAKLRNDLGISPNWLTHPFNRTTWNIPVKEWASRQGVPNAPNVANATGVTVAVSHVSHVSQGMPEPPSPVPEEDLLGVTQGAQTLADRVLANARMEGSLPPPDPPPRKGWPPNLGCRW